MPMTCEAIRNSIYTGLSSVMIPAGLKHFADGPRILCHTVEIEGAHAEKRGHSQDGFTDNERVHADTSFVVDCSAGVTGRGFCSPYKMVQSRKKESVLRLALSELVST